MMKRAVHVALVALFLVTWIAKAQEAAKPTGEVTEVEYQVYSAYIASEFTGAKATDRVGHDVSNVVIEDATQSEFEDWQDLDDSGKPFSWNRLERFLRKQDRGLQPSTLEAVRDIKAPTATLRRSFRLPIPYELVSGDDIGSILKDVSSWQDYYKKYPGSQGFLTLSRVGFSLGGKQALFYAVNLCGGKCATGAFVVMKKSGPDWRVEKEVIIWVS